MAEKEIRKGGVSLKCSVIGDLIPLVKDGVASKESTEIVYEHIDNCDECREEFEFFQSIPHDQLSINDETIIRAMKRSIWFTQFIILIVGACIGIALTNSIGMFYNLLIMPAIGAISYLSLRKKVYIVPVIVFVTTYIWQTIMLIVETREWSALMLSASLIYSTIYAGLICIGIVIAVLLSFAFSREEKRNEKA